MKAALLAPIALPRWQRWGLYAAVAAVAFSGLVWLWASGWPDVQPSPAAAWSLRVHGIAAYALLVFGGSVLPVHVAQAWQRRRNRWSGATLAALLLALAGTGLWLYYGGEAGRDTVSTVHWAIGLGLPVWLLLHRAWGLRARRRA